MNTRIDTLTRICPECKLKSNSPVCPKCGAATVTLDEYMKLNQDPDKIVGKVLMGKYKVIRLVGIGGMGNVYEVNHELFNKRLAIKVIKAEMLHNEEAISRFKREAMLAAKLDHPNIVKVYDYGATDTGQHFILMEFVEGVTLRQLLKKEKRIEPYRAAVIALQIAKALDYAHRQGVVHRDLKPDNIFVRHLSGEDFVKVVDFGVAKLLTGDTTKTLTKDGYAPGTPEYMSPEQVLARPDIDGRADIYSLGVIMYEMITGIRPFRRDTPLASAVAHLKEDPPPFLPYIKENVPDALEVLIFQMMNRNKFKRPKDAQEVINRIKAIQFSQGAAGTPSADKFKGVTTPFPGRNPPMPPDLPEMVPSDGATVLEVPSTTDFKRKKVPFIIAGLILLMLISGIAWAILHKGSDKNPKKKETAVIKIVKEKAVGRLGIRMKPVEQENVLIRKRRKIAEIKIKARTKRRKKRFIPQKRRRIPKRFKPVVPRW